MSPRVLLFVASALLLGAMSMGMPRLSTAAYTTRLSNTGSVTAAPDWTPPTASVQNPGSPLKGTVTVSATAADPDSGIQGVALQYLPQGGGSWTTVCTATMSPYSCTWNTTAVTDGSYELRAVATDRAGYSTTSDTVSTTVANSLLVVLSSPGDVVRGTVSLPTTLYSAGTTTYTVRVEYAPAGASNWKTICANLSSPFACSWNTTTVANGLYDLRAVLTDGTGKTTTSTVVGARRVDNSPLRGADVQAANGGGTAGRLEAGDTITFAYSRTVQLSTVTSGWSGTALPVTVRLRDGAALGLGSTGDSLDVQRAGGAVNLGLVNLREDYLRSGKTVTFNATMTATTVTVNGVPQTQVTVSLGTPASGKGLRTVSKPAAMTWAPSAAVLDTSGNACATTPVTESGALDREF